MITLIQKYEQKLYKANLVSPGHAMVGALDDECIWNQAHEKLSDLNKILSALPINALIFANPKQPYAQIINHLAAHNPSEICPQDTESKTFLHSLPVIQNWDCEAIIHGLSYRKGVIILNQGIIASGAMTPEQAFVVYSSICFACFVAYFSEHLQKAFDNQLSIAEMNITDSLLNQCPKIPDQMPDLAKGPFLSEDDIYAAITEVGKQTVQYGLVDSYFGNVSYYMNDTLFITQTASSLDELTGCIDPCPLDGSSCVAITASSEFSAHKQIVQSGKYKAILHGHPRFSVVISMFCKERYTCPNRMRCHTHCSKRQMINSIPIIPGEVGCGPHGLIHTLPNAFLESDTAIVYGHGVFTVGESDFMTAFERLALTEIMCHDAYINWIHNPGNIT